MTIVEMFVQVLGTVDVAGLTYLLHFVMAIRRSWGQGGNRVGLARAGYVHSCECRSCGCHSFECKFFLAHFLLKPTIHLRLTRSKRTAR